MLYKKIDIKIIFLLKRKRNDNCKCQQLYEIGHLKNNTLHTK